MTNGGFKYFVFASVISADNDTLSEDTKQEIISRFGEFKHTIKEWNNYDWEYILEPIKDKELTIKILDLIRNDDA